MILSLLLAVSAAVVDVKEIPVEDLAAEKTVINAAHFAEAQALDIKRASVAVKRGRRNVVQDTEVLFLVPESQRAAFFAALGHATCLSGDSSCEASESASHPATLSLEGAERPQWISVSHRLSAGQARMLTSALPRLCPGAVVFHNRFSYDAKIALMRLRARKNGPSGAARKKGIAP
ncbi:MAG: hypothetical protein ACPG6R_10980 [Aequoribacter sp.]|uniref:hypothetical protein n=1 Tax=Aequoribacter sp. TaxID=2847771 RepID=UPI003C59D3C3